MWYRPAKTVAYVQELSCFLVKCRFRYSWYWQKPWNMAKNCQASFFSLMWCWQCPWNISKNSLFNFSFATPGTGEDSGIWPRIVLVPYLVSSFATPGTGEPSGIWPRIVLLPSVSVSLHLVLAKTMEYIQELACILVQRHFRYVLHWQRPRYMAGTGDRGVSLYTCPGAQPGGWGSGGGWRGGRGRGGRGKQMSVGCREERGLVRAAGA